MRSLVTYVGNKIRLMMTFTLGENFVAFLQLKKELYLEISDYTE